MDGVCTWNSFEVDPHDISLEDSRNQKLNINKKKAQTVRPSPTNYESKLKPLSTNELLFNLRGTLCASIKGKLATGDSILEVMKTLSNSALIKHIEYLNTDDLLNCYNSTLDFGETPNVIKGRSCIKRGNAFFVPKSSPCRLIVEYGECQPDYEIKGAYESSNLKDHNIYCEDFLSTIKSANEILLPYNGLVAKSDCFFLIGLAIGLALTLSIGLILGALYSYIITFVLVSVFVLVILILLFWMKKRNAKLLVYAHLALSVFVRCENNRLYLKHKVLVRPGYLAKWIEFNMVSSNNNNNTIM